MKTLERFLSLAAAATVLFACGQKDPEVDPVVPEPEPETRTLTFVLPSVQVGEGGEVPASLKTAWVAGDQIVVHGEYAKDQVTVTLGAGDISADGKSATLSVSGLYPYKRDDCASTLYASYPAKAVDNLKHCFFYSKFSTTNEQLLAASNSGDTFQFQNVCGILTLSVGGDYEAFRLSTPKKDALGYEFLQVKLTDGEQNYRQYLGDPVIQIDGSVSGGKVLVFVPEGTTMNGGFSLKLMKGGAWVKIFRESETMEFVRGTVVDLGDVSDKVADYDDPFSSDIKDLDTDGNANCYIVSAPGAYKFKAVVGNKATQFVAEPDQAEVLWETWNDMEEVTPGSVVASASYAEDYIILHTPAALKPGNAVVAVKNADGQILWSWHIWVPATPVTSASFGGIMGKDLMDRNLGALLAAEAADAAVDPLSYGMVYQWGRKDPFTNAGTFKGSKLATVAGAQDEVASGKIGLEESIANPRLLGHIDNGDWLNETLDDLWSDNEKTIYDPCPAGYRVPPMDTSVPFWNSISSQDGWGLSADFGWMTIGNPATVLPVAGYRDDYDVGGIAKVGSRTLYWNARGAGAKAYGDDLRIDKSSYNCTQAPKARLGSVRCVKE